MGKFTFDVLREWQDVNAHQPGSRPPRALATQKSLLSPRVVLPGVLLALSSLQGRGAQLLPSRGRAGVTLWGLSETGGFAGRSCGVEAPGPTPRGAVQGPQNLCRRRASA